MSYYCPVAVSRDNGNCCRSALYFFNKITEICYILYIILLVVLSFSFLFLFLFLLLECLWWLLEVSGNPCPKGASRDPYPEPLLHPGGSVQLHWTAFQQRPDGQRGRYKAKAAKPHRRMWDQPAQEAYTVLIFPLGLHCWTLKGRDFGSVTVTALKLLQTQARTFLMQGFGGEDHQHFSSALEATVKLHPRPIVEEGKGLLYEAFGKKFWSYLNKFYMQKLTKENNGNHSFSSYLLTKFLSAHSCTSHPQCCSLEC